mmetsp:Transcript_26074/g.42735  ORF Transcript_26074/g.42735 Transcript_26074/m.42735 type:complete len:228 (+) Transcript_26074:1710-2393(+)
MIWQHCPRHPSNEGRKTTARSVDEMTPADSKTISKRPEEILITTGDVEVVVLVAAFVTTVVAVEEEVLKTAEEVEVSTTIATIEDLIVVVALIEEEDSTIEVATAGEDSTVEAEEDMTTQETVADLIGLSEVQVLLLEDKFRGPLPLVPDLVCNSRQGRPRFHKKPNRKLRKLPVTAKGRRTLLPQMANKSTPKRNPKKKRILPKVKMGRKSRRNETQKLSIQELLP